MPPNPIFTSDLRPLEIPTERVFSRGLTLPPQAIFAVGVCHREVPPARCDACQFRLDVPDHKVVVKVPDQTVPFDLTVGDGAGNLDQITDFNRMPGEDGPASGRGQRHPGSPGLRPTIARLRARFESGGAWVVHYRPGVN
jgi:hypothetical protein